MAKPINTLHILKAKNDRGELLILQFVDRDIRDATADAIERAGGTVVECHRFGTAIERSLEAAIETARFWGAMPNEPLPRGN